jgi:hypothetical protein
MLQLTEAAKWAIYRTPVLHRLMAPVYPYKVSPGELAAMVDLIEATRGTGEAIAEVGVAKGDTSVFLLEHLRWRGDDRPLLLFDTFTGFTAESTTYEVGRLGKQADAYDKFRYGDQGRFERNLRQLGLLAVPDDQG